MNDPLEILVVEPHHAMRTSLCTVLAAEDDLRIVAKPADLLSALRDAARVHADVAIVDDRAALLGAGSAAATIGVLAKRVPVVVIGMGEASAYRRPYIDAGAFGYWCKADDYEELTALLRRAAAARRRAA